MRHRFSVAILATLTLASGPGQSPASAAEPPITLTGTLRMGEPGQTPYSVLKPADWNGTLVLDLDFNGWNATQRQWFLDHGYAIGGMARTQNQSAYEIHQYIDNYVTIRSILIEKIGAMPKRTIAYGVSRGGIPARGALEAYPDIFDGVVAYSGGGQGMIGFMNQNLDGVWTLKTLVDPKAPLALVNLPAPAGTASLANYSQDAALAQLAKTANATPEGRARLTLAAAFVQEPTWTVRESPQPAPRDYDTQIDQLAANFAYSCPQVTRWQLESMAGGNISWNHGIDYRAALNRSGMLTLVEYAYRKAGLDLNADLAVLAKAPRIAASPSAIAKSERDSTWTGRINGPVLSLKTSDPADVPAHDLAYLATLRRAGTDDLLRNTYVARPFHATYTALERITAFQTLVSRLDTGRWDDSTSPEQMNALAARIKAASPGLDLGVSAFTHSYPTPPLRTWDVANWGTYQAPQAPQSGVTPIVSNERVSVRDVTLTPGKPGPMEQHAEDSVTVFLTGGTVKMTQSDGTSRVMTRNANEAVFAPKGGASRLEAVGRPVRAVMIDLHDHVVAPLPNTTGLPEAFPRPGSKKVFENDRIFIWDYTFVPGQPSPMHFHSRDVVTIYTDDGAVTSTTPAGEVTVNDHVFGQTLFNPRNRTHTEVLSRGKVHIVVVELK